jgi:hypothetical protein
MLQAKMQPAIARDLYPFDRRPKSPDRRNKVAASIFVH